MADILHIVIEDHVPFVRGVLEPFARVSYLPAAEINRDALRHADALITRTRTRVDARLLDGIDCRFVATATIGTDHIDTAWCRANGVTVVNAPGCNAPAVAQYVLSSILHISPGDFRTKTLGIVGVGHVGSIVDRWARSIGMTTLLCDPPRADREGSAAFVDMEQIAAEADIVTFHTPLTRDGRYPTFHLCDDRFLSVARRSPLIINAARGAVVDTAALLRHRGLPAPVIDCWENEPQISAELLARAFVATPHIAGYSRQGKIRATRMAVDALCRHFGLPEVQWPAENLSVPETVTPQQIIDSYDPLADTLRLRLAPDGFERQRNAYPLRNEPLAVK